MESVRVQKAGLSTDAVCDAVDERRYEGHRSRHHAGHGGRASTAPAAGTGRLRRVAAGLTLAVVGVTMVSSPVLADHLDDEVTLGDGDDFYSAPDDQNYHVIGGGGADSIYGGGGDDHLEGGAGDDFIVDDHETSDSLDDDTLDGGPGDDELIAGAGNDTIIGGDGDDFVESFEGDDTIDGGAGDDTIIESDQYGPSGDDTVDGGDGQDVIVGSDGDDDLSGGSGNDLIDGDGLRFDEDDLATGNDRVDGGDGHDYLLGGLGDDEVLGGSGDDVVFGDGFPYPLEFAEFVLRHPEYAGIAECFSGTFGDDELIDCVAWDDLDPEMRELVLQQITAFGFGLPGGDDRVDGGEGRDLIMGMNGHDEVCGDADDLIVTGGGGSDVPCVVFEEQLDASDGPVTADLAAGMRSLDDEEYEVDESGDHNPLEFVVDATLVSSAGDMDTYKTELGTLVVNRLTGDFTYTPDDGASGTEEITYTVRRRVVDCADYSAFEFEELVVQNCEGLTPMAVGPDGFNYAAWRIFTILIQGVVPDPTPIPDPVVVPIRTPGPMPVAASTAQLPATGSDLTFLLALAGLGLVGAGTGATTVSRRLRRTAD